MNEKQRKEAMRAYYASIAFLDAQVGKGLDAVQRLKFLTTRLSCSGAITDISWGNMVSG